jgi:hypothetical protein
MQVITSTEFRYVSECDDRFLSLFPHRFDYIWADHVQPGKPVNWQTESRHPLSDRQIRQGSHLYGVRFGSDTNYCMLDIDAGSLFHPSRDRWAVSRILETLEPLGLVASVACSSSYSGGLHLYFPIQNRQKSWELALTVSTLLERSGFKLMPGQLELFPNPKNYSASGEQSLFNAHRLPLQLGSYLLNEQLEPVWTSEDWFVQRWQSAQTQNELNRALLNRIVLEAKRSRSYRLSGKADKFIQDLNTEISLGWTGFGQTNYLLGRIAMRTYIFHAVLTGEEPLTGLALVQEIVKIAKSLPGYDEWCRHHPDLEERAAEWASCVESSRYFPYGSAQGKFKAKSRDGSENSVGKQLSEETQPLSWNQQQSNAARDRIRQALAQLLETNSLPTTATARFQILTRSGIGGSSLYRHKDLWHPQHLMDALPFLTQGTPTQETAAQDPEAQDVEDAQPVENYGREKSGPDSFMSQECSDCAVGASSTSCSTSLLSEIGRNQLTGESLDDLEIPAIAQTGRNSDSEDSDNEDHGQNTTQQLIHRVKAWLTAQGAVAQAMRLEFNRQRQTRQLETCGLAKQARAQKMQHYLTSGDPILMAEARAWFVKHPEWEMEQAGEVQNLREAQT